MIDWFQVCCELCVWCGVSGLVVALVPAFNEEHMLLRCCFVWWGRWTG
ncbi:MAG: hypothetical protein NWE89_12445 [Candidatus Bathyarchaeota archaeon]|nr:hypothetical protein [Candidatus Bathyarchaeota archaeon]